MSEKLYIALFSIHGLIRGKNLELGSDADTGGQVLYVLELANALARRDDVERVELFTRLIYDDNVDQDYRHPIEPISEKLRIVRIAAGPDEYISKEQLWDHLDVFIDNTAEYFHAQQRMPDVIHSHYADAGYVGSRLANQLGVPLIHTGHSLGRVKRHRLLASGLTADEIEQRYNMLYRIEAEETTLSIAERVITSTHQEIEEQYELYDHYLPEQMHVIPPGTNLEQFIPATGDELNDSFFKEMTGSLIEPTKPIILALSRPDKRKNIAALIDVYGASPELQDIANLVIIAGNRDDIEELDEGAQEVFRELLLLIDRYDLYGKVSMPKHHTRDQVSLIYRIAAATHGVFINPALTEPFGLTLIESAASGLPIVATEDGGPRDIIANCQNGYLIDPLSCLSMIDALKKLLTDSEDWQNCAQRGLTGVKQHYSWDAHAEGYVQMLQPILEKSEVLDRTAITRRKGVYRERAVVSDLDLNLIGDEHSLKELIAVLKQHRKTTKFIIATGRRFDSALRLMKRYKIPEPDMLITSSGSEIYYAPKFVADMAWHNHIDYHWSASKVKKILQDIDGLTLQPRTEQSRFKISYYYDASLAPDVETLNSLLHQHELSVHLQMAFGQYLDVLPQRVSKGMALRYLADRWQIPLERILVAGGSGSDEDMMRGNTHAAVVANRHNEELSQLTELDNVYFANKPYAAGILEAMEHYHFFDKQEDDAREAKRRLLLCTDMDRTIIPNGEQQEHELARKRFASFCSLPEVALIYVTGRHRELALEAIKTYHLPEPDFLITDVGTVIYKHHDDRWEPMNAWASLISENWHSDTPATIAELLADFVDLRLQEPEKQNIHKLSYYTPADSADGDLLEKVKACLDENGFQVNLVWSVDEKSSTGLLDILPQQADKLEAIKFLARQLGYEQKEVLFAGDSGNDISVLCSLLPAVLVANATESVKDRAIHISETEQSRDTLYVASGKNSDMNGNYTAGVLEGVAYFRPEFSDTLRNLGINTHQSM